MWPVYAIVLIVVFAILVFGALTMIIINYIRLTRTDQKVNGFVGRVNSVVNRFLPNRNTLINDVYKLLQPLENEVSANWVEDGTFFESPNPGGEGGLRVNVTLEFQWSEPLQSDFLYYTVLQVRRDYTDGRQTFDPPSVFIQTANSAGPTLQLVVQGNTKLLVRSTDKTPSPIRAEHPLVFNAPLLSNVNVETVS